jgi:hypothetical protein
VGKTNQALRARTVRIRKAVESSRESIPRERTSMHESGASVRAVKMNLHLLVRTFDLDCGNGGPAGGSVSWPNLTPSHRLEASRHIFRVGLLFECTIYLNRFYDRLCA